MQLDDILADVVQRLARGVDDRRSPFRTPTLATVDAGRPRLRTVVLRGFDPAGRRLVLHSDVRAAKIAQLRANPAAALHVWDEASQIQVTMDGHAKMQAGAAARPEWERLHPGSRATYQVQPGPGTVLGDPADATPDGDGFDNFAVIAVEIIRLEWLLLARGGNRRARWDWSGAHPKQEWLVP